MVKEIKRINDKELSKLVDEGKVFGPIETQAIDNGCSIFQMFWSDKKAVKRLDGAIQKYATKKGYNYYVERGIASDNDNFLTRWCEFYRATTD